MEKYVEYLQSIELFSRLGVRDARTLAGRLERIEYDRDDYLSHQGELGNRLFILDGGRAVVWRTDPEGVDRPLRRLGEGDYFGITSLLLDEVRDATVRVQAGSAVLVLTRDQFNRFLEENPAARDALVIPPEIAKRLEAPRMKWMTEDETAIFFARKTRWLLLWAELLPAIIFLGLMTIASLVRGWSLLSTALSVLALIIGGGLALLRWLDWRNDYYVLTNKRAVHQESRLPTLQVTVDQAPLAQIQNVTMLKLSPIARALNFGTVEIQTAGRRQTIAFRHLDNPERCQQIVFELIDRSRSLAQAGAREAIRDIITQQVRPVEETEPEPTHAEPAASPAALYRSGEVTWDLGPAPAPPKPDQERPAGVSLAERLRPFLPHFREERGSVVTWHKHPFILIKAVGPPLLLLIVTLAVSAFLATRPGGGFGQVALIAFLVWCISLTWLLWKYEDWRNDLFQMTASHLVDVDRMPLGLRESRRQAALEQVQNINVDIPNIWARLFNYGFVVIETAGATGDLRFEWVMNPRAVQAEIFQRLDAVKTRQREGEAQQRRREMASWFAVYHQMQERDEI